MKAQLQCLDKLCIVENYPELLIHLHLRKAGTTSQCHQRWGLKPGLHACELIILPTELQPKDVVIPKKDLSSDRVKKQRAEFVLAVMETGGDQFNLDSRHLLAYGKSRS